MKIKACFYGVSVALCMMGSMPAYAQTIEVEGLEDPRAFDSGVLTQNDGALPPELWSGTPLSVAKQITENAPNDSRSAAVRDMVARVLLSPGSPPQGGEDNADWAGIRLGKIVDIGRSDALDVIFTREPRLADSDTGDRLRADSALSGGDVPGACLIADGVLQDRGAPYWAKLRAFCHITRDELPAAELTVDVLRRSGHEDAAFYAAFRQASGITSKMPGGYSSTPLLSAMLAGDAPERENTLDAFIAIAPELSPELRGQRLSALAAAKDTDSDAPEEAEGADASEDDGSVFGTFDVDFYLEDETAQGWGRLYGVMLSSTDGAIVARTGAELLRRAEKAGIFTAMAELVAPVAGYVPANLRAQYEPELWARMAVEQGDLNALRTLYDYVPEDSPLKGRLALASDALGNGFVMGQLGHDITDRVLDGGADKKRAIRDVFLASALGARLGPEVTLEVAGARPLKAGRGVNAGALLALEQSARAGSLAETALRAAAILGDDGPSALSDDELYRVVSALYRAGLYEFAGRVAAEDFMATP